ncbi:MAG: hypothetical protein JRI22_09500 [Deltaproteobacteria bacterium]|nr:hypothetical protein [Deltaproteobacteria bacterium]
MIRNISPHFPPLSAGERWFAWEGMTMVVPRGWNPAVLQKDYLRLEDARRPTLELRWRFSARKASIQEVARAYVSRLEEGLGGRPVAGFEEVDLAPVTDNYEVAPFSVEAGEMIFRGAAILCPRCGRIVFLQAGMPRTEGTISLPVRIISSFRDFHSSDWVPWTLFDIGADVPGDFRLHSHSFQPGYFRMTFREGSRWMTLHRWAPADVILRRTSLEEWAAAQYRKEIKRRGRTLVQRGFAGFPAVEVIPGQGGTLIRRLGRTLLSAGRFRALLWHNTEANRVFGVETEGRGSAMNPLLYEVAGRFKALHEHERQK